MKSANAGGYLVIKRPWPSMLRTIWGDNERYIETYWAKYQNRYYVAGDSAHRDADGYYWIMGRIDDVLNVAGHRLGTMEIESALVAHPLVAEAAVVSKAHDIKGESVFAYVTLNIDLPVGGAAAALIDELRIWVGAQLSPIAKPDEIRLTENLPKTRSGKIMRRLLRAIARGEDITQDVSTLENPAILDQLRGGSAAGASKTAVPKSRAIAKKKAIARKKAAAKPGSVRKKTVAAKKTGAAKKRVAARKLASKKKVSPRKGVNKGRAAKAAPKPKARRKK